MILKPEEKNGFIEAYVKQLMREIPDIAPYLSLRLMAELGGRKLTPEQRQRAEGLVMQAMALNDDTGDVAERIADRLRAGLAGLRVIATREQEMSCNLLSNAVAHDIVDGPNGKEIRFRNHEAIREFYQRMLSGNDAGIADAAMLFARCLSDRHDEPVIACFLAEVASTHYRESGKQTKRQPLLEPDVGLAGALVNMLLGKIEHEGRAIRDSKNPDADLNSAESVEGRCRRMVRLFCLMGTNDPARGLYVQPTELIRGLLFATRFRHDRAARFWELAAEADDFPLQVFSDPSRSHANLNETASPMFSNAMVRSFGLFLDTAPEKAAERFAAAIATASRRWRSTYDERTGTFTDELVATPDDERITTFQRIVGYVPPDNVQRRELLIRVMRLN